MPGRFTALTLAAVVAALLATGEAHAHRISAEASYRLVRKIKVESYFSDDTRPKGAVVQVFHEGEDTPILEDHLNAQGELEFIADLRPLRVVVNAGEGHVKEVHIPAADTSQAGAADATTHIPSSDPPAQQGIKDVLVGMGVLFGIAAFVMSLWNARQLRALRQKNS